MRSFIVFAALLVGCANSSTQPATRMADDGKPFSMDAYHGTNRPVLVFMNPDAAGEGESAQFGYAYQMSYLQGASAGLAERDVVVIGVEPDKATLYRIASAEEARNDPDVRERGLVVDRELGADVAKMLREKYDAAGEPLKVVLVGKDGGVKLTDTDGIKAGELFMRIDAMPMRQREMRDGL